MSLFDRMQADNQRILSEDMIELILTNAVGTSQTADGRITAPGMSINLQGFPIVSKKRTVAFHISDFATITGLNETYKNWQGEFLNSEGETVKGRFTETMVDKTFGYVVTTLTGNKA